MKSVRVQMTFTLLVLVSFLTDGTLSAAVRPHRRLARKAVCTGGMVPASGCEPCPVTCDGPMFCAAVCKLGGCKCPEDKPIWYNNRCIKQCRCNQQNPCPVGEICDGGQCVLSPCATVRCPANTVCEVQPSGEAACLCGNTVCGLGEVCDGSKCVLAPTTCATMLCPKGTMCDESGGQAECVALCNTKTNPCPLGENCEVFPCLVAPCTDGKCVSSTLTNPCAATTCLTGTNCQVIDGKAVCVKV
jgi:hypothetical protein